MNNSSSSSSLLIVGSLGFDTIETPFGKGENLIGGSGTYCSLAAGFFTSAKLVAVAGEDFLEAKKIFDEKNIDTAGVSIVPGKTLRWGAKYNFDLNNRQTLFTELNVLADFEPSLPKSYQNSDYIFLSSVPPAQHLQLVSQLHKPKFIGLDTISFFIEKDLADLKKILEKVDLFVINDTEARELSGEHNLIKAAKKIFGMMKPNTYLIIKRGEYGLLMFDQNKMFHLPGYPLEDVVDPTGAGDAFAGGLMGYLSKTRDTSWENLKRACVAGSVMASFCVEKLGTEHLVEISEADINQRFTDFQHLTHFET
jgi:sugar/nucleoside kinase (ribokinase family)